MVGRSQDSGSEPFRRPRATPDEETIEMIWNAMAFGSNIAGSVVGGLCESFSMLTGFRYLILIAIAFYLLSSVKWRRASAT